MFVYKRGKSQFSRGDFSIELLNVAMDALHSLSFSNTVSGIPRVEDPTEATMTDIPCVYPDGRKERVQFDKITARVSRLCYGLDADHVDAAAITQKVISGVYQGVTTIELDNLVCAS